MSRSVLLAATAGVALIAGLSAGGCAAAGSTDERGNPAAAGRGSEAAAGETAAGADNAGAASEGGAPDSGATGGRGMIDTSNGDGGAPDGSCAADVSRAEVLPLDMYIMLDVSASMTEPTSAYDSSGAPIPKWTAIKSALRNFIEDRASAELGVGIQFFPLKKPDVPESCSSDAECGNSAPCQFNICSSSGIGCSKNADCGSSLFNTCIPVGQCGDFFCEAGTTCEIDGTSVPCTKLKTSVCQHTAYCDGETYAAPAQAIAPIAEGGATLLHTVESQVIDPYAQTPIGPALSGAIEHAKTWAKQHANHRVVTVLATDGLPNECLPTGIPDLGRIAAAGLAGTPSISTFTIGVFSGDAYAKGQYLLNTIAEGGGTTRAFLINTSEDVANKFRAALDSIRATQLACEFKIPEPAAAEQIDYSLVNVNFKNGKKESTLLYVAAAAGCDPLSGGWYYDTDPGAEDPSRIIVCPTTCATFESATSASVEIAVGCKTIVK